MLPVLLTEKNKINHFHFRFLLYFGSPEKKFLINLQHSLQSKVGATAEVFSSQLPSSDKVLRLRLFFFHWRLFNLSVLKWKQFCRLGVVNASLIPLSSVWPYLTALFAFCSHANPASTLLPSFYACTALCAQAGVGACLFKQKQLPVQMFLWVRATRALRRAATS